MKKIIAVLVIAVAIFVAFKTVKIYPAYKSKKTRYLTLKSRESDLKSQILAVKKVEIPKTVYGYHRLSTYLFTFFSYVNYLKGNGYKCKVSLKKAVVISSIMSSGGKSDLIPAFRPAGHALSKPAAPANLGQIKNISYFIGKSNTFYGLKKAEINLTINKYYSVKDILLIIGNIENLFPSKIKAIKISKKQVNITFVLYGV